MSIFDDPVTDLRIDRCERVMRGVCARYGNDATAWPDRAHRVWTSALVRRYEANVRWYETIGKRITVTFAPLDGRAA